MGTQHNSHIVNQTDSMLAVVLTDNDNRTTSALIKPGKYVCIPTPHGRNTVSVYKLEEGETLDSVTSAKATSAQYTDDSDRSFIVRMEGPHMQIVRSVYGHIYQEDRQIR